MPTPAASPMSLAAAKTAGTDRQTHHDSRFCRDTHFNRCSPANSSVTQPLMAKKHRCNCSRLAQPHKMQLLLICTFQAVMSPSDPLLSQQVHTYYTEHHGWIRAWLNRKLGNASDAADLAHDVFVRLLAKPRRFDSDNHARAYLYAMSRHVCVDFWRRQQLERAWLEVLANCPEAQMPSEEERAMVLEVLQQVNAMLARVPENVARTFVLVQVQGLSYREVAMQLGVSERTVTKYMAKVMFECLLLEAELDDIPH